MRNVWTIATKEFKSYWVSPIGYVVLALWLLFAGVVFSLIINFEGSVATMEPIFNNCTIVMLIMVPLLTMRLIAGERPGDQGTGTIEMLLTAPISEWELVLGKYLASVLYLLCLIASSLVFVIALNVIGNPDMGLVYGGYIGFVLMGAYMLAFGLLMSSLTNSQLVAAVTTIIGALVLWLLSYTDQMMGTTGKALSWISYLSHHRDFWTGVVALPDVLWFVSFIFFYLWTTRLVVAASRQV